MDPDEGEGSAVPLSPPKKSLFKKSAWARPTEEAEAVDFFSRSKEIFSDIVAEEKKKRQERLERKRSKDSAEREDPITEEGKRRKVSVEEDLNDTLYSSEDETRQNSRGAGQRKSSDITPSNTRSRSTHTKAGQFTSPASGSKKQRSRKDSHKQKENVLARDAPVISLSDSDEDVKVKPASILDDEMNLPSIPIKDANDLSDEEMFPELVAKARAKAKQTLLERLHTRSPRGAIDLGSDGGSATSEPRDLLRLANTRESDPIIQILLDSQIEGTVPLIVRRKLSQRMKDVRLAWCDKQRINGEPMPREAQALIFLTWRGKRIFDVTTCKALGLKLDKAGKILLDGEGFDNEGKIHLEAWTEESFAEFQKAKQVAQQPPQQDPEEEDYAEKYPRAEEGPRYKVILNGKGSEPLKLVVKPKTRISKMTEAFRSKEGVPADREISLWFDGEKLDPDSVAGDADLDPEDITTIDVHVN